MRRLDWHDGLWTNGASNLASAFLCQKATFPPGTNFFEWRFPKNYSNHRALQDLLASNSDSDIDKYQYDNNLFLLGTIRRSPSLELLEFSMQCFATIGTSIATARSAPADSLPSDAVRYYRCEFHPGAPGKIFAEPPVHWHVFGNGSPRFNGYCEGDVILAFLEFIALQHQYDDWNTWCGLVAQQAGLDGDYVEVERAFARGRIHSEISSLGEKVANLRQALNEAKSAHRGRELRSASVLEYVLG